MRGRGFRTTTSNCDVCLLFITAPSSLFQRRTNGQMILWRYITQIKLIALSLFTRRRRVVRSANYPGHEPGARSLQRNAIRRAGRSVVSTLRQRSSAAGSVLFILRIPLSPASLLTDSCTWRRRDADVVCNEVLS